MTGTDVVVVGAGFAGLSAAALLARRGVSVEVFESLPAPGGRARCEERDGFILDHGIHGHRGGGSGSAAAVLRELGEEIEWVPGEHRSYLFYNGERHAAPESLGELLGFHMLGPSDRARLVFLLLKMLLASPKKHSRTSLAEFAGRWSERPGLRPMLQAMGTGAMAADTEKASAGEVIELLGRAVRSERSVGIPKGGERQVLDKLVRRVDGTARLNLRTRVRRIQVGAGGAEAVETTRGAWRPKAVLFTAPIQKLFKVIDKKHFRPGFRSYAEALEPTAGISVDLALAEPVTDIGGAVLDLDQQLMGRFPSVTDPELAPPGRQLATWLWVLEPEKLRDREFLQGAREAMRKRIERLAPGTMKAAMWERWLYFPILDGAHLKTSQAWRDRHPLRSGDVSNLFFAGDTAAAPGVGGDIAFASALAVAPMIERFLAEER